MVGRKWRGRIQKESVDEKMARFTGFLVQALLVGLSLLLNASHNSDVIRDGIPRVLPASSKVSSPQDETTPVTERSNYDYKSNYEAGRSLNSSAVDATPDDDGAPSPSNEQAQDPVRDDVVTNSTNAVDLAREEDSEIDESVSPKGGKLVSIPSVEMDALRGRRGADDRIIGVSKAELFGTSPSKAL